MAEGDAGGDLQAHVKSYNLFSAMLKWGTIICFLIAFTVVIIIA